MRYFGEANVPGAPGNFLAGGNFMGGQGSAINPEAFKKDARQQKIYNKGVGTDNPNEREIFLQRTGPQLPFAGFPGAIGNMGGLVAQAQNVGATAGAGALGGGMGMNSQQMQYLMQTNQQQGGGPPIQLGVDIENEKVKNLRGSVNAQLDANQAIQFGGNYNVQDQTGRLDLGYQTPMFGFGVGITRTPGAPTAGPSYGFEGNVKGRF